MANPVFVADELVTATKMNQLPKGWLVYAQVVANQTGITTAVDLTGLTATVVPAASRRLKLTAKIAWNASAAVDALMTIQEGSTVLQGGRQTTAPTTTVFNSLQVSIVVAPTGGSHTYKVVLARIAGSGTILMAASAADPAFLLVEDLGAT